MLTKCHLLLFAGVLFFAPACTKFDSTPNANVRPAAGDVSMTVQVNGSGTGLSIPSDFTGLSFETGALLHSNYFNDSNQVFIRLIQGLGSGVLRIGGNSVDRTPWAGANYEEVIGSGVSNIVTPPMVDRFFQFAGQTGWKVMFALDLGTKLGGGKGGSGGGVNGTDDSGAVGEARYVYDRYAAQLSCLEIGNEPDLYSTNGLRPSTYQFDNFRKEWDSVYAGIHAVEPSAVFSGPASSSHTDTWTVPFGGEEYAHIHLLTQHYYKMGPASDPTVTIARLLEGNSGIVSQASTMHAAAREHQLAYRISECNSVFGGGKTGVSNTFASALWGVDFMFVLAEHGAAGVNFHGGGAGPYTAIADSAGVFSARPLYYGMLFFSQACGGGYSIFGEGGGSTSGGMLLSATVLNADSLNLAAHAVRCSDGRLLVTLINKDLSQNAFVTVKAGSGLAGSATLIRLAGAAPDSSAGVMLGGAVVGVDGSWPGAAGGAGTTGGGTGGSGSAGGSGAGAGGNGSGLVVEHAGIQFGGCTVRVPACSAVLLSIH